MLNWLSLNSYISQGQENSLFHALNITFANFVKFRSINLDVLSCCSCPILAVPIIAIVSWLSSRGCLII
jgi:hypothetical protein